MNRGWTEERIVGYWTSKFVISSGTVFITNTAWNSNVVQWIHVSSNNL